MGRTLIVLRLVLRDVRRHPAQAAVLLVSLTVAIGMLSLGASLRGATDRLYLQTRAATAGPDLVALHPGRDRIATSALTSVQDDPRVLAHSRPYRQFFATLTAHGATVNAVVLGTDTTPGSIDRPLVTSGTWVRPGSVVVERGFATALGIRVGDRVLVANRSFPVAGIAVTAARTIYPWAQMNGPDGGRSDRAGLVWITEPGAKYLISQNLPVTSLIHLKLRDPGATQDYVDSFSGSTARVTFFTWQFMSERNGAVLRGNQPILVIGSWLLSFLAVVGLSTLAAGRAAAQTRRVGLLKAIGATPGLIATVLFAEYFILAMLSAGLGLTVARLAEPVLVNPSGSLISIATGPSVSVIVTAILVALTVAALTTIGPIQRALRTSTVTALSDTVRRPQHRARLTAVSALLPTPLLLGLRLIARRPGRALLHTCSTAATVIAIVFVLLVHAQPRQGWNLGPSTLPDLQDNQNRQLLLTVTAALITLAVVNTFTITWTTALEAQATMAIARTLGATPGQITAGLSTAQLLPTLPGAIVGILAAILPFTAGGTDLPPTRWLLVTAFGLLLATAVLTALPARIAARRSIARTLSAETR